MADRSVKPTEIYLENTRLKSHNDQLQMERARFEGTAVNTEDRGVEENDVESNLLGIEMADKHTKTNKTKNCSLKLIKCLAKYIILCSLVGAVIFVLVISELRQDRVLQLLNQPPEVPAPQQSFPGLLPVASQRRASDDTKAAHDILQKYYLNIGMRRDYQLQECQGPEFKQSFPDVDYALLGYNILKGFPLSVGHDPGFAYPIFKADYSSGGQTADCRYSVPHGLVVIPDVSCITSFSSTTVQNKYEFSKSLSVAASVNGGGWGVSFSASAGYKQASSEMATGESVFILSTASCNYYFSKLLMDESPQFTGVFHKWILRLNETTDDLDSVYLEFFETFGTHFPTEVTFGARFTYEHKMSSKLYETQQSNGVNVAVQASYSGLFSVGGGFNLDSSQRQAASDFSKSVTTKTITVGAAPPASGDAMTWASEVKTSPVPTAYKLSSIENLFTDRFMGHLNVDLERVRYNIDKQKQKYCISLLKDGVVESCEEIVAGIQIEKTRLYDHYRELVVASVTECIETCLREISCEAITYCSTCKDREFGHKTCFLYKQQDYKTSAGEDDKNNWQSNIFTEKIKTELEFIDTAVVGNARGFEDISNKKANMEKCKELCIKDAYCVAYTHCECPQNDAQCQLFSKEQVKGLQKVKGTKTYFISSRSIQDKTSTPATITSPPTKSGGNDLSYDNY